MIDRSDEARGSAQAEELSVVLSADEARALDNWSASQQIEDRAEAVHRLVNLALDADREPDDVHLR